MVLYVKLKKTGRTFEWAARDCAKCETCGGTREVYVNDAWRCRKGGCER